MRNFHVQIHLFAREVESGRIAKWRDDPLVVEHARVLHLDDGARVCDVSVASAAIQLLPVLPTAPATRITVQGLRGRRVLVNGWRAPSVAVARGGDEIALEESDAHWRLHVSVYRPVAMGRAGAELSGRECPLCLGRFSEETRVFRCGCGSALHAAEGAAGPSELDCARAVTHCPDCRRAIVLESGYEDLPRDDSGRELLPSHRSDAVAAGV
jgi:hypothetical protein